MAVWKRPFRRPSVRVEASMLVAVATQMGRQVGFFGPGRVADTLDGRLEVAILVASLVLIRLRGAPEAASLTQSFTDVLFRHFDAGLREDGVGDLAVPRRMRKIASAFYGRLEAYAKGLEAGPGVLEGALSRNMLGAEGHAFAPALAHYARACAALQGQAPVSALFGPEGWARAPD